MKNIVWVESNQMWEHDYINHLFEFLNPNHIFMNRNFSLPLESIFALVINEDGMKYSVEKYLSLIKKYKPVILVHLSDEYYICENLVNNIYSHFKLVLRQHSLYYYKNNFPNSIRIPFGYMNKVTNNLLKFKDGNTDRKYFWSFIGQYKNKNIPQEREDRMRMIDIFLKLGKNHFLSDSHPKGEISNIYSDTLFVPLGRNLLSSKINHPYLNGEIYQDCNRIYDAIMCGAIPITIGNDKEIEECFHGSVPPIIYENSWEKVLNRIINMSLEEILQRRKLQKEWWQSEMRKIQENIRKFSDTEKIKEKKIVRVRKRNF